MLTGSELEVSYCQPAEVGPAGPHAARRLLTPTSSRQQRCTSLPACLKEVFSAHSHPLKCLSCAFLLDVEASAGENQMERWARERRERRQARARKKAQRSGEVNWLSDGQQSVLASKS